MTALRRALLLPVCLALLAAGQADHGFELALQKLAANDPAGAVELLAPWCQRHPDDANGWLALGVGQAQAGLASEALRALAKARAAKEPEVARRASFDLARVLFEKAQATPRAGTPGDRKPDASLVADVRTRLALLRFELETARDLLIDLADETPADREARRGLAAVSELLRVVVAEDRAWREKAEPPKPQMMGQGAPAPGPLKPGPSAAKSSAGASGKKTGESAGGANSAASGAPSTAVSPWITPAPLDPSEEAKLGAALRRVRDERERADERRAEAQAQSRGVRSW